MIDDLRKVLALSALLSVLVAALFTFGAPVQAQVQSPVNAQNQQNILVQSSTTQGVPTVGDDDQDTGQSTDGDETSTN
jgi:hypothetical protein